MATLPPPTDLAVETHGLRRRFGDFEAVAGVDIAVRNGEMYGFLGPNGAGKSTLVRMLTTLLAPSEGTAMVAGYDVVAQSQEVRLRIGAALQEAALDPKLSGRETLELQGRFYGLTGATLERRLEEVFTLVDIGDAIDRRTGTYSGGMKRRLDLAAALVHEPEVLFLDEPTTGLDPISRVKVWDEVRRLNAMGMTIFLTTQYLEEADALCDRVGIISEGRIVAEGPPDELKRRIGSDVIIARVAGEVAPAVAAIEQLDGVDHVGVSIEELTISVADGSASISPVAVALSGCGVKVLELTLRTPSLDDVFLELTGTRIESGESLVAEGTL